MHALERLGQQVVVLGCLQGYVDAGQRSDLAAPQARAVDDVLGLDGALVGHDTGHPAALAGEARDGYALDDPGPAHPRALGQRHADVDRVGAALVGHVEAGEDVVGLGERPHLRDLERRDLVVLDPEAPRERCLAPKGLQPPRVRGQRDVPDGPEPGRQPRLLLKARVQVAGVAAHPQRRLVGHPGRGDQPGRVPGGPRGELVALEQQHVPPAQLGQVVREAGSDHTATDDDDLGARGQGGGWGDGHG